MNHYRPPFIELAGREGQEGLERLRLLDVVDVDTD